MLNFVVCDDNIHILDRISKILESIFIEHNFDANIILKETNAKNVLKFIEENYNKIDVLLLDINLKSEISGLDIAKKLRDYNKNAYIIFTTGHLEYVMMAYKYKTFDYLPKPITFEKIEETVIRLFNDATNNSNRYLKLVSKNMLINEDDIYYIKKDGMRTIFISPDHSYEIYNSFSKIQNSLPSNFIRCHKSYIVNINKISDIRININKIYFKNNISCSIGPKYKNNLLEVINNHGNNTKNLG